VLLVHGLAAAALAVVVLALGRAADGLAAAGPWGRVVVVAGLVAVAVSLVQFALGELMGALAAGVIAGGRVGQVKLLFDLTGRLDGVKMLLLAALIASGAMLAWRTPVQPRWLAWAGALAAAALLVSAAGYLLLVSSLALAAAASLPLLLLWACAAGIALGRNGG
jgi:hypothetical protein